MVSTLTTNSSQFCSIQNGWTTKHSWYAFLGVSASYINGNCDFKTIQLTLKHIIWHNYGVLLACLFSSFLMCHVLHTKICYIPQTFFWIWTMAWYFSFFLHMIAQTTDSAASYKFLAHKLKRLFMGNKEDPIFWDSQGHKIWCFCHKLEIWVKHRLDPLKLNYGHIKPTTQPNIQMPIPIIKINRPNQ